MLNVVRYIFVTAQAGFCWLETEMADAYES